MTLTISGTNQTFERVDFIADVLERIGIDAEKKGIAIAKNGTVVPRRLWQHERITDGDAIEIVRASQGG